MSLDSDLRAQINSGMPGYRTATIGAVTLGVLFDAAWAAEFSMEGTAPSLFCVQADVPLAVEGTAVVLGSTNYEITSVRPDGFGGVRFILSEV